MIRIHDIISILTEDNNLLAMPDLSQVPDVFGSLSYDSRQVAEDTLFFAKGAGFKASFLKEAKQYGLDCYVSEVDYKVDLPVILVSDIKQAMSLIAKQFYGNPQDKLKLLAFTGTKGKTTAAYFAYHILSQSYKPALLSTMQTTLDGVTFAKSELTTPESLDLFAMMAEAVANGRTHLIMEVSSQAYLVKRVYGLTFDVGVFLNISPDHIGPIEHPNFEDYFYHKRLLMVHSELAIINAGMDHADQVMAELTHKDYLTFGFGSDNHIAQSHAFSFELTGILAGHYDSQLLGYFNQENALAAGLACHALGASLSDIHAGISETTVPGRMEVLTQSDGSKVFVDYAHNKDSLEKLLEVVLGFHTGRVILVIGAPGNKGESRRKDFGELLNAYPTVEVVLTADDPNFEDPLTICQEIASHMTRPYRIEVDRQSAISQALSQVSNKSDAVIIAGKGADNYQIINGKKDTTYIGDVRLAKTLLH